MKPLSAIEQVGLVFSLAVVAAMLTQCATPAHAQPIKSTDSIGKTVWTAGDAREYSVATHKKGEPVLADSQSLAHKKPRFIHAAFSCVLSSCTSMVRLDGGVLVRASFLESLSANPVQSNHHSLAANDSTSINSLGVNYHD